MITQASRVLRGVATALLTACALTWSVAFFFALHGCAAPRPLQAAECHTDATTASCGICTSETVCAWCATTGPDRGCVARTADATCSGTLLRFPEACETFSDPEVYAEP